MQDLAYSVGVDQVPPPPRYIGITELEGKPNFIYGAQSLRGKILMSQNLAAG
jgi:hypothetical protein